MSLKDKIKIKKRKINPRNHLVVVAKFRNSSGAIQDAKKQSNKNFCREKVDNGEEEEIGSCGTEDAEEEQE